MNRGVAILGDSVYYASTDAHLIALDARTGSLRWDVTMADYKIGYSSTGAPLAVKDKIITGMAGGEYGVRGFIDAYDAKTGKRAWRFYTIPAKGEPGNETWAGDSWKTGSATTWVTGVYDPERTPCTGARAIRGPTGTATSARATTCTPTACWRSMPIPAQEMALPVHAARRERLGLHADARRSSTRL